MPYPSQCNFEFCFNVRSIKHFDPNDSIQMVSVDNDHALCGVNVQTIPVIWATTLLLLGIQRGLASRHIERRTKAIAAATSTKEFEHIKLFSQFWSLRCGEKLLQLASKLWYGISNSHYCGVPLTVKAERARPASVASGSKILLKPIVSRCRTRSPRQKLDEYLCKACRIHEVHPMTSVRHGRALRRRQALVPGIHDARISARGLLPCNNNTGILSPPRLAQVTGFPDSRAISVQALSRDLCRSSSLRRAQVPGLSRSI